MLFEKFLECSKVDKAFAIVLSWLVSDQTSVEKLLCKNKDLAGDIPWSENGAITIVVEWD